MFTYFVPNYYLNAPKNTVQNWVIQLAKNRVKNVAF